MGPLLLGNGREEKNATSARREAWRDAREQAGHWMPFAFLLHRCMFALQMISIF